MQWIIVQTAQRQELPLLPQSKKVVGSVAGVLCVRGPQSENVLMCESEQSVSYESWAIRSSRTLQQRDHCNCVGCGLIHLHRSSVFFLMSGQKCEFKELCDIRRCHSWAGKAAKIQNECKRNAATTVSDRASCPTR